MKNLKYLILFISSVTCVLWIIYDDGQLEPYVVLATLTLTLLGIVESNTGILAKFWNIQTKKGETNVKTEWKDILKSTSNTDIFLIRGARLFDQVTGSFYLPSLQTSTNIRILLLDFHSIDEHKYDTLVKHYALDWKGLSFDRESYQNTLKLIDNIKKSHYKGRVEVKKYDFEHIPHKKIILFDNKGYYTEYKTKSEEMHQHGYYHSVKKDSPIYNELKNFFDHVWKESEHAL